MAGLTLPWVVFTTVVSGGFGASVGGLTTWLVARRQINANVEQRWRDVAATAYATTYAVAAEFNAQRGHEVAKARADDLPEPAWVERLQQRAADVLTDLERTSVLSDDTNVQGAATEASRLLRELAYQWGHFVDWTARALATESRRYPSEEAALRSHRASADGAREKVEAATRSLYGTDGTGGALERLRSALRGERRREPT